MSYQLFGKIRLINWTHVFINHIIKKTIYYKYILITSTYFIYYLREDSYEKDNELIIKCILITVIQVRGIVWTSIIYFYYFIIIQLIFIHQYKVEKILTKLNINERLYQNIYYIRRPGIK